MKTHLVVFRDILGKMYYPFLAFCDPSEAEAIEKLLYKVGDAPKSPMSALSINPVCEVKNIPTITLAEVRKAIAGRLRVGFEADRVAAEDPGVTVLAPDDTGDLTEALECYGSSAHVHTLDGHYVISQEPLSPNDVRQAIADDAVISAKMDAVMAANGDRLMSYDEYCKAYDEVCQAIAKHE